MCKTGRLSGNSGVREFAVIHLVCVSTEFVIFCFQETWILALRLVLQVLSQLVNTIKIKKSGMDLFWKKIFLHSRQAVCLISTACESS